MDHTRENTGFSPQEELASGIFSSNQFLRAIWETVQAGVVIIDEHTRHIVAANPKAIELIGRPGNEILGRICHRFICPAEVGRCPIADLNQPVDNSERVLLNNKGEGVPILKTVSRVTLNNHSYLIDCFLDLRQMKHSESILRESEAKFRRMVQSLTSYAYTITLVNGKMTNTYHSDGCMALTGFSAGEYHDNPNLWLQMVHPDDQARVIQHAADLLAGHDVLPQEHRIVRKDGQTRWIRNVPLVDRNSRGEITAISGLIVDITEKKLAEEKILTLNVELEEKVRRRTIQLEQANQQMEKIFQLQRAILDGVDYLILTTDQNGVIRTCNRSTRQHLGLPESTLIGKFNVSDFVRITPPGRHAAVGAGPAGTIEKSTWNSLLSLPAHFSRETPCVIQRGDGTHFPAALSMVPLIDPADGISGYLIFAQDVTENQRLLERMRMSEERLKTLLELANMGSGSLEELIAFALEKGIRLTRSKKGFIAFPDGLSLPLLEISFSGEVVKKAFHQQNFADEFWAGDLTREALRQRKTLIDNRPAKSSDESPATAEANRLIVPILEGDSIPLIAGVCGSQSRYDQDEADQLLLLMKGVWQAIQRRKAERERDKLMTALSEAHEQEHSIGSQIQQSLLMGTPPAYLPGLEVAAKTLPYRGIDGDFYDFFVHQQISLDILFGDVMGKGIPAALLGAAAKGHFQRAMLRLITHSQPMSIPSPEEIVTKVHAEMTPQVADLESFICLHFGRFDLAARILYLVNCGHTQVLHFHHDGEQCEFISGTNSPLGLNLHENYRQVEIPFQSGDVFLFYSDGLPDTRNEEGEFYGLDRVCDRFTKLRRLKPRALIEALITDVKAFSGEGNEINGNRGGEFPWDDLSMIVVTITAKSRKAASR